MALPAPDAFEILGYVVVRYDPDTLDATVAEPEIIGDLEDARTFLHGTEQNAFAAGQREHYGLAVLIEAERK